MLLSENPVNWSIADSKSAAPSAAPAPPAPVAATAPALPDSGRNPPLVSELVLADSYLEGIRDILVANQCVYVAVGDRAVDCYRIVPAYHTGPTPHPPSFFDDEVVALDSGAPSPFLEPITYEFPGDHSFHRCPRTTAALFDFPVPGMQLGAAMEAALKADAAGSAAGHGLGTPVPSGSSSFVGARRGPSCALFTDNASELVFMDLVKGVCHTV